MTAIGDRKEKRGFRIGGAIYGDSCKISMSLLESIQATRYLGREIIEPSGAVPREAELARIASHECIFLHDRGELFGRSLPEAF